MVAKGLVVDKCRVMSSKKLPLWLVFDAAPPEEREKESGASSASPKRITVLFKAGDDLRQDQLTLQVCKSKSLISTITVACNECSFWG
jgi:phosphatidylinositol-4,5-bisphosphate 3-kinase